MKDDEQIALKWWHKLFLAWIVVVGFNQIKGCFGLNASHTSKRDACSFIQNQQYPYDWENSAVGACITKAPPRLQTRLASVPDPWTGSRLVPVTEQINNEIFIRSPLGRGTGAWQGGPGNIRGTISTHNGNISFYCVGQSTTGSDRGICRTIR